MSRYLILVLINLPLIISGLLGALVDFKMHKTTRFKFFVQLAVWLVILAGLASAKFIYGFFYYHHMTTTASMSLFDVIEFTGLVFVLFIANRSRIKNDRLERRLQDLHQELSIRLSGENKD